MIWRDHRIPVGVAVAPTIGHDVEMLGERPKLRLPVAVVARSPVDEHERFSGPLFDIVQLDPVDVDFLRFHLCIRRHVHALLSFSGLMDTLIRHWPGLREPNAPVERRRCQHFDLTIHPSTRPLQSVVRPTFEPLCLLVPLHVDQPAQRAIHVAHVGAAAASFHEGASGTAASAARRRRRSRSPRSSL
jgi:hypothetical protein